MSIRFDKWRVAALLLGLAGAGAIRTGLPPVVYAHEGHEHFAAGEPGDPKKPARTIRVLMLDDGSETDMKYEPASITVRKGEQIRFVLENSGTESHEFMLATIADNLIAVASNSSGARMESRRSKSGALVQALTCGRRGQEVTSDDRCCPPVARK